jgi:hypothetical protein
MTSNPLRLILIGFALMVLGTVLPFLMVLHIIESTFFLNFFSYTASLAGLFMGLIGLATYVRVHRKKPPEEEPAAGKDAVGAGDGNVRPTNDL